MCCSFSPGICLCLESTLTATLDFTTKTEPVATPAPEASAAPADSSVTAESEKDEKEDSAVNHSQAEEEEKVVASDETEEPEKMQDKEDKETGDHAVAGTSCSILFELEP